MARPSRALVFALGLAAARAQGGDASGAELRERLDEIRRQLDEGGERLQAVGRQLQPRSIYASGAGGYSSQDELALASKHMWLLACGALVMLMNGGFAMLKAGSCRVKNVQHVFVLCLWDVCIGTIAWWIVGWSFGMTGPYNPSMYKETQMMGYESFAGHNFLKERASDGQLEPTELMARWVFMWAVSTVALAIASGGVAERSFVGCAVHSFLSACVIFPFVVGFTWGRGWLMEINRIGYMDFAGSGVVNMVGGFSALAGAIVAGARPGRFSGLSLKERLTSVPDSHTPHSQPLVVFGTLTAWFGWYGLNCGFVMGIDTVEKGMLAAQVAMNTTIAAAVGGLTAFIVQLVLKRKNDIDGMCFGILAGLVSISASCNAVECGSAAAIGATGGVLYPLFSALLKILRVDDPVDAFAVHGVCGIWGLIAMPLLDWGAGFGKMHGRMGFRCIGSVNCYEDGTKAFLNVLGANSAAVGGIIAWAGGLSAIVFGITRLARCLKPKPEDDEDGLDRKKHIPDKAYNFGIPNSADMSLNSL